MRRFSNLVIGVLGSAFLISPINPMAVLASESVVKNRTPNLNEDTVPDYAHQHLRNQDLYGSIAVFAYGSYYGFGWNYSTKQEAIAAALQSCFNSSRGKCRTAIWFRNGCGALATAMLAYGAGYGPNKLAAQRNALDKCSSRFCRIRQVVCTRDVAQ